MQNNIASIRQKWNKAKFTKSTTFWIAIGAVILTIILGFSLGGWVTDGSVQRLVQRRSQEAVTMRLAQICTAQFSQDPERNQKLGELKALNSSFQRGKYVTEQGWATMPGETAPDTNVGSECAQQILLTDE